MTHFVKGDSHPLSLLKTDVGPYSCCVEFKDRNKIRSTLQALTKALPDVLAIRAMASIIPPASVKHPLKIQVGLAPEASRIAPEIGVPTSNAMLKIVKHIPMRVPITPTCGERQTKTGPVNETKDPEKHPYRTQNTNKAPWECTASRQSIRPPDMTENGTKSLKDPTIWER